MPWSDESQFWGEWRGDASTGGKEPPKMNPPGRPDKHTAIRRAGAEGTGACRNWGRHREGTSVRRNDHGAHQLLLERVARVFA